MADVGNALDDRPPTVAWAFPTANARLQADPSNPLTVTAADDRGVALVRFLDDDRVICEDHRARRTRAPTRRPAATWAATR